MTDFVQMESDFQRGPLRAKDSMGTEVWSDEDILYRSSFDARVQSVMAGHVSGVAKGEVTALMDRVAALERADREKRELMQKMAKRLDEIDGGDEWDKLNQLCWETPQEVTL